MHCESSAGGNRKTRPTSSANKKFLGVTWVALAAMSASFVAPVQPETEVPELRLNEVMWEDAGEVATESGLDEDVVDNQALLAEATESLNDASQQLAEVTDSLQETPALTTTEDREVLEALTDVEQVVQETESLIDSSGTLDTKAVESATDSLEAAVVEAEQAIAGAAVDASPEEIEKLQKADEALTEAVTALAEVTDDSWIPELNGWVPNVSSVLDPHHSMPGLTGQGIDIAVIDSGIAPVPGLDGKDKIINGPDLSTDGVDPSSANVDLYGHGTHLAGIIAGNDSPTPELDPRFTTYYQPASTTYRSSSSYGSDGFASGSSYGSTYGEPSLYDSSALTMAGPEDPHFTGIAPNARLVNLKVADAEGNTTIPQIVAAIEWAILNKNANGMNIRVLTLAFGYDGPEYLADPIAAALQEAWANGIVVVVAGGNQGDVGRLDNPAVDPFVIATAGTDSGDPNTMHDDHIASWSSTGDGVRNPDVAAPGRSIVSLRAPGSYADTKYPESRIGDRFAVASGTSQSSAVLSGAVALLLEHNPKLTPDQVKYLLMKTAVDIEPGQKLDGYGTVMIDAALTSSTGYWLYQTDVTQKHPRTALPEGFATSRGGWAGNGWSGSGWSGAGWSGAGWSGSGWSGSGWSGSGWN